jgi:hypothetical protein
MSFTVQAAAGISVSEIDLTTVPTVVSTSIGAVAGIFHWGPVNTPTLVANQDELARRFGKPTNSNYETFFTGANFLDYGNQLYVVRAANTTGFSNTLALTMTNTVNGVVANGVTGLANGYVALGTGVPSGTFITNVIANSTFTTFQLSKPSSNTTPGTMLFYSPNTVFTAVANTGPITRPLSSYIVGNFDAYALANASFEASVQYLAKWPGSIGNSLQVAVCETANQYSSNINLLNYNGVTFGNATATSINFVVGSNSAVVTVANTTGANDINTTQLAGNVASAFAVGDFVTAGNTNIGTQLLQVASVGSVVTSNTAGTNTGIATFTLNFTFPYNLGANIAQTAVTRKWQFFNSVSGAPGQSPYQATFGNTAAQDQLHVVVVDQDGLFTGVPSTVLETFSYLSRATNAKTPTGAANYYAAVINGGSQYVWFGTDRSGASSNTADMLASSTNQLPLNLSFGAGSYGDGESVVNFGTLANAYDTLSSTSLNINMILAGKAVGGLYGEQNANYLIDNVAAKRLDCVVIASPPANTVVTAAGAFKGNEATAIANWDGALRQSSYLICDTMYKYGYDKYADTYRYFPGNGDIGGTCVYTDTIRAPWFSPAGYNRGKIKNSVKLAYSPSTTDQNFLYPRGVNPVVVTSADGTVLLGDKTHLTQTSAFGSINVRRLFIVLEKSIATAAKYTTLFEFNDDFTRSQFVSMVTPFLRDVKGQRGITDFKVVCDTTNNTADLIDQQKFVGDIYIKPARSINWVQLNFVAVRTGVDFSEIVGQF